MNGWVRTVASVGLRSWQDESYVVRLAPRPPRPALLWPSDEAIQPNIFRSAHVRAGGRLNPHFNYKA